MSVQDIRDEIAKIPFMHTQGPLLQICALLEALGADEWLKEEALRKNKEATVGEVTQEGSGMMEDAKELEPAADQGEGPAPLEDQPDKPATGTTTSDSLGQ